MNNKSEILNTLDPLIDIFQELRIKYYIGGSIASSAHGVARATLDIDICACIQKKDADKLYGSLKGIYYVDKNMINEALKRRSCFNLIHLETMIKIDVFIPQDRAYDKEILKRIITDKLLNIKDGRLINIVSLKLEWYRKGNEVSERQLNDISGVLKLNKDQLNIEYLTYWAKELNVFDLLEKSLDEV